MIHIIENTVLGTQILNINKENMLEIYKTNEKTIIYKYLLSDKTGAINYSFYNKSDADNEFEKILSKISNIDNPVFWCH